MKKKILALAAAIVVVFSATGCSELENMFGNTSSTSTDGSGTSQKPADSTPENSSSDPDEITTKPQTVRCGDIIEENGVKVFDTEITCGNAFAVGYHYIRSENGRIENAILSIKPMKTTDLETILNDPLVGGSELSISDFELINGIYRMNEEKAKTLLGSLATTYGFDQYWKNQKMAELVSTEGISAEEARPKVDEMFENMGKNQV